MGRLLPSLMKLLVISHPQQEMTKYVMINYTILAFSILL